jgi:putative membrane protein
MGVVLVCAAVLCAAPVRAESEAEYDNRPASTPDAPLPAPRPVVRLPVFAASSAAGAKPLSAQQRDERRFLKEAAASERFQADAARTALARSATPSVRSLATSLLAQQHPHGDELVRLLHQRAMAPPMLANEQRRILNRLAKLQGHGFDREFLRQVALKSQQDEVRLYERAAGVTADPTLRAWIEHSLPDLKYRLADAERIAGPDLGLHRGSDASTAAQPLAPGGARAIASRPSEWNSR